ncbi:MAG: hypothetical protein BRC59_14720 [Cyanobacteria bacterium SW_4_48_29]|nr:MAG: hypothetical protein BRC59_14720 [Cyanobacteria bacterium SW_4_48_29]
MELKQQGTQQSVKKIMNRKNNQIGWSGRERATLIGVCVAGIMLTTDITSVGVALDKIAQELNASLAGLQWVMNAYNLTFHSLIDDNIAILTHVLTNPYLFRIGKSKAS